MRKHRRRLRSRQYYSNSEPEHRHTSQIFTQTAKPFKIDREGGGDVWLHMESTWQARASNPSRHPISKTTEENNLDIRDVIGSSAQRFRTVPYLASLWAINGQSVLVYLHMYINLKTHWRDAMVIATASEPDPARVWGLRSLRIALQYCCLWLM
jgi:hypothetical protein